MFYWFIQICFLALVLSSCVKKSDVKEHQERWHHCQARLHDIPIIISAKPINTYFSRNSDDDAIQLGYTTTLSLDSIIEFYRQEMERMGWIQLGVINGYEVLMHFEKPRRFCSVSIRKGDQKSRCTVVISVGFKG